MAEKKMATEVVVEWTNRGPGATHATQMRAFKATSGTFSMDTSLPGYVFLRHDADDAEAGPSKVLMVIASEAFVSFQVIAPE